RALCESFLLIAILAVPMQIDTP
ncbi:MAG: hypothetical protein QOI43_1367, partial [Gaiellales bacterium]|nr:hypothetical protein [Gaiellales bacterium]